MTNKTTDEKYNNPSCEVCGVIATPYGGMLRLKSGGVLHMDCALRYSELRIRDVEEFVEATGEI